MDRRRRESFRYYASGRSAWQEDPSSILGDVPVRKGVRTLRGERRKIVVVLRLRQLHADLPPVVTPRRNAALLPRVRLHARLLTRPDLANESLVVADEDDRLPVRRPVRLRALGHRFRVASIAIHEPDLGEAAAERGVEDLL